MKKILALLAVVLGVVSCQTEPEGLDVNVGGEVDTTITVSLPETETRANSAEGAFKNLVGSDEYTIRYIFQVFYKGTESLAARQVIYSDGNTVNFPVRLVPGREYNFVVWADVVPQAGKTLDVLGEYSKASDYRYNTEDLQAVTFNEGKWYAMDETFDAYTDAQTIEYYGTTSINLHLTRPFAKLRVMTTDMVELRNLQIVPEGVTVAYSVPVYKSFDVTAKTANTTDASAHTFTYNLSEVQQYTATETTSTLFTNYLFGAENGVIKFEMSVYDNTTAKELIKFNNFSTDIPVQRNYLTTISGNILTDGNNVTVKVEDGFAGTENWPDENEITEQLAYAAMFGGEVTLTEDVVLTQPLEIVNGANVVINLDGKTITGASVKGEGAIIENNGILTLVGGTIKNTEINGDAVINNNGELVLDGVKIEGAPLGDGGYSAYAVISSGKMTINGGTKVYADRGCLKLSNGGETFINGGLFVNNDIGTRSLTSHVVDVEDGGNNNLTINGGTFEHRHTNTSGGVVICNRTKGTVYVNGGKFSGGNYYGNDNLSDYGCGGTISVTGGTYSAKPADKYLATGYKAVQSGDKYMVVKEDVGGVATDNATLDTAIKNAQDGDTIALNAGEYVIPDSAVGKTITFVGTGAPEDTLITAQNDGAAEGNCDYSLRGSKATFENVTITTTGTYFPGYAGCQGTYKNCIINGVFTLYDSSSFEDCTFNISGDLYNVWTWGAAEATFTNCTFNCDGKAMLLYGQANTKLTMNNCVFNDNGDDTVTGKAAIEIGNDYNKSYELTVNNATVNGFAINPNGFVTGTTLWANKNSMPADKLKVTVDGKNAYNYVAAAHGTQSFTDAINNGATEVALSNGNYTMPEPDLRGKTLTISGTKDVVIDATAVDARDQFVTGATMVFDGVTINFGKVNYMGFANTASLTYKNCKINGLQFLFGENVTFENCEFDSNGAEHSVWTYGAKNVSFTKCDFTYGDRCVNCYSDNDVVGGKQTVNFTECTFATENTASEGAVEINSCFFSVGIEVNLNGCTAPAYGQMAYVSRWDSTNGAKTTINIE